MKEQRFCLRLLLQRCILCCVIFSVLFFNFSFDVEAFSMDDITSEEDLMSCIMLSEENALPSFWGALYSSGIVLNSDLRNEFLNGIGYDSYMDIVEMFDGFFPVGRVIEDEFEYLDDYINICISMLNLTLSDHGVEYAQAMSSSADFYINDLGMELTEDEYQKIIDNVPFKYYSNPMNPLGNPISNRLEEGTFIFASSTDGEIVQYSFYSPSMNTDVGWEDNIWFLRDVISDFVFIGSLTGEILVRCSSSVDGSLVSPEDSSALPYCPADERTEYWITKTSKEIDSYFYGPSIYRWRAESNMGSFLGVVGRSVPIYESEEVYFNYNRGNSSFYSVSDFPRYGTRISYVDYENCSFDSSMDVVYNTVINNLRDENSDGSLSDNEVDESIDNSFDNQEGDSEPSVPDPDNPNPDDSSDSELSDKLEQNNQLQQESNQLQDENNQLQEENNALQEEQNETSKGILGKITEFFGGFFENLKNAVVGIFVPDQETMQGNFERLDQFFSDTFGFLYYPFDFLIEAVDIFLSADSGTSLTFPGFSIMGYEVWSDQSFDLTSIDVVNTIFETVRLVTGGVLAFAFINYLRSFFDKRFGGGGA